MAGTPHGMGRYLLLVSLCLSLAVPVELHGTVVEVGAHDIEGAVSVDARHAGQEAHFEHSAIEMQSRCAACVLTQKFEVLPSEPEVQQIPMPRTGTLIPRDSPHLDPRLDHQVAGRAPPPL